MLLTKQKADINSIEHIFKEIKEDKSLRDVLKKNLLNKKNNYSKILKDQDFLSKQIKNQKLLEAFLKTYSKSEYDQNELLTNRMKEQLKEIQKNIRFFDSIKNTNERIEKSTVDRIEKKSKIGNREMEQLIKLTKRYYIKEHLKNIVKKISELAKEQKILANINPTLTQQKQMNEHFKNIISDIDSLEKTNRILIKPIEIKRNKTIEETISRHQKNALEQLKNSNENYLKSMERASEHMNLLAKHINGQIKKGEIGELKTSIQTLRRLIDHTLAFSFEQEKIYETYRLEKYLEEPLKRQAKLKIVFQQIETTLTNLSMSLNEIGAEVNKTIENIYAQTDASMAYFQRGLHNEGLIRIRKTLSSANKLSSILTDILNNLELNLNNPNANSQGEGEQIKDIIKQQEQIGKEFEEGKQKSGKRKEIDIQVTSSEEILRLYQKQQKVKRALEKLLEKKGASKKQTNAILKKIDEVSKTLLSKGYNDQTISFSNLIYKFKEIEKSIIEQGESKKRKAEAFEDRIKNDGEASPFRENTSQQIKESLKREALEVDIYYKKLIFDYYRGIN
ncbi:glutamyl-tRNA synthetase [Elysia marginata]|uniref:Glutamyl-tRNA synthetase n=1 Tax=Elysia marginata TaxID=1093978 RepID=A0AAV4GS12_9GAST|nr:glutamyl-tRNA synthetase [Elysia marginata]